MKTNHTIFFTQEGFDNLKKEHAALLEKRKETVEHVKRAREMGDLSENGYYKAAKFELGNTDRRIREIQRLLKTAKIAPAATGNTIEIGSSVVLKQGKNIVEYRIVGEFESDPMQGKLSHKSPLGIKLMGKKVGEEIHMATALGKVTYTISAVKS